MSFKGMMDGWNGDETECHGNCGICEQCEHRYDESCDSAYEAWRDEVA